MAEEKTTPEKSEAKVESGTKGGMMKKLLIYGIPAFLVQLVVIYFLTAKFVVPMTAHQVSGSSPEHSKAGTTESNGNEPDDVAKDDGDAKESHIYVIKDMIINPAGTNGQRYLLSTIAFNVSTEEALRDFEKKEMAVRDMLNSILTSKSMEQLIDVTQREGLRTEIAKQAKGLVNHGTVTSVYFSKYIIQ
jgi:flagellar FliL protein